ncbi:hypothetical protein H257_14781 [Aphanomyces astaci]|uniref:Uncharacterized protein n=1 Tax=Aphanomyces astaci TaxID=112090 RepID=W4FQ13_APHAT|nr:hypothetical protein H257_14781 [Aphanomyces astaci]ETV69545.1 hypothetical protein H257_14781 [Aphanomyces astaci]|eukprot:XP_009840969.1 hypothetical protein H257_14781 [Aphanomyces astaci]
MIAYAATRSSSDDIADPLTLFRHLPPKAVRHRAKSIGLDGKKASSRFYQLLRVHRKFQESSKYLSGVEQENETGKIMLLDELIQLFDEASDERQAERATTAAKPTEKGRGGICAGASDDGGSP